MESSTSGLTSLALDMMMEGTGSKKKSPSSQKDPMTLVDKARQLLKEAASLSRGGMKDTLNELISVIDDDVVANSGESSEEDEAEMMTEEM